MPITQRLALLRQPLVVSVDMSFESSCLEDMALLCSVKEAFDLTNIQAMLQINNVSRSGNMNSQYPTALIDPPSASISRDAASLLPQDVLENWEVLRRTFDNNGRHHCPIAIFSFSLMHINVRCAVPLPEQALHSAKKTPRYSSNVPNNVILPQVHQPSKLTANQLRYAYLSSVISLPITRFLMFSHLNDHIRNDTDNSLLLRRRLHKLDADLIIEAWNKPINADIHSGMVYEASMLYYRLLREPVYKDLVALSMHLDES